MGRPKFKLNFYFEVLLVHDISSNNPDALQDRSEIIYTVGKEIDSRFVNLSELSRNLASFTRYFFWHEPNRETVFLAYRLTVYGNGFHPI